MFDLTTVHGASPVWPASTSGTTTPLPRRQCSSTPRSLGESFHCRTGSNERAAKPARLFGARDREPQLDQVNAGLDELPLTLRVSRRRGTRSGCSSPTRVPPGAVVPRSVELHRLASTGQVNDVAARQTRRGRRARSQPAATRRRVPPFRPTPPHVQARLPAGPQTRARGLWPLPDEPAKRHHRQHGDTCLRLHPGQHGAA